MVKICFITDSRQSTFDIDRLIQTTPHIKWRGDFKQTRNGTAIITSTDTMNIFDNSILIIVSSPYTRILMIVVCILILAIMLYFYTKRFSVFDNHLIHSMLSKINFGYVISELFNNINITCFEDVSLYSPTI